MTTSNREFRFSELLQEAVSKPGTLSSAYSAFHTYSLGNMLLAAVQCWQRKIPLGPLATFPKWKELGRHVRKGEKALTLCQPVTIKRRREDAAQDAPEDDEILIRFMFRNAWFVLAQTDGADIPAASPAEWDKARALAALDIEEIRFAAIDGNVQGYAMARSVAINPVAALPIKTLFHECAHILLGHTAQSEQSDSDLTPRSLQEAEAECVALLCCEALNLPGAEFCRAYVQRWWGAGSPIPERSAQRILRVADQILKAGQPAAGKGGDQ